MDQGGRPGPRVGPAIATAVGVLLAGVAYRPLLLLPTGAPAAAFERWLFEPRETAPLAILAGAIWLLWRRRHVLAAAAGPTAPGLAAALFCFAASAHVWATATGAAFLLVPSLIGVLLGGAALRAGAAGCRAVALPAAFLLFALPLPGPLLNHLVWQQQEATAALTASFFSLIGAPATSTGILFERPGQLFVVIETCSGFRFAAVFAAIGVLLRGFAPPRWTRSAGMGLFGLALGLLLNELRVLWIASLMGPWRGGGSHTAQGVVALVVGVPVLVAAARLLERRKRAHVPGLVWASDGRPAALPVPMLVLALLAAVSLRLEPEAAVRAERFDVAGIPAARGAWQSELLRTDYMLLGSVRFNEVLRRGYERSEDEFVELFVGSALSGDPLASPFSRSIELPELGWTVLERGETYLAGRRVERLVIGTRGGRALAYTWRVGDAGLRVETLRAALALDRNPFGTPRRHAVVRIATDLDLEGPEDRARADSLLQSFAQTFADSLP